DDVRDRAVRGDRELRDTRSSDRHTAAECDGGARDLPFPWIEWCRLHIAVRQYGHQIPVCISHFDEAGRIEWGLVARQHIDDRYRTTLSRTAAHNEGVPAIG